MAGPAGLSDQLERGQYYPSGVVTGADLDERVFTFNQRRRHKIGLRVGQGLFIDHEGRPAALPRWVASGWDLFVLCLAFLLTAMVSWLVQARGWVSDGRWFLIGAVVFAFALGWALRAAYSR